MSIVRSLISRRCREDCPSEKRATSTCLPWFLTAWRAAEGLKGPEEALLFDEPAGLSRAVERRVISSDERTAVGEFGTELGEVQVRTPEMPFQFVVRVVSIDKDHPAFVGHRARSWAAAKPG